MRQLRLKLAEPKKRGGKRPGAGRPRKDGRRGMPPGMPHLPRPAMASRFPVGVTWRMEKGVWNLRSQRCFKVIQRAMYAGGQRDDFRLVHFAVLGNHIHLLVEASDRERLMRGLQGLGIRIAKRLNQRMGRSGRVISDRYHAHILKTPTEVRKARTYLLKNAYKHYGWRGTDPYASQRPFTAPRTWLMRQVC